MTDPADLDISSAAQLIASGELSPTELADACLRRAERLEPAIKAFVTLDADGARSQAQRLTEELAGAGPRSVLHGIPVGIKDLIDVAGLPTTASSRVLEGNVAVRDAEVVTRLREAGAVIMGKANTHEFAYGVVTPPTANPWDVERIPGGSSGGSAAAVAAGMCLGALGTDTAGSVRIPSALCGLTGLMPRHGRVSLAGVLPLAPTLDSCGPLARKVEDAHAIFDVLTGQTTNSSHPEGVRMLAPDDLDAVTGAQPEVARAIEVALEVFSGAGLSIGQAGLPPFREWDRPRSYPLMLQALEVHRDAGWYPRLADLYTPETLGSLRFAEKLPADKIEAGLTALSGLKALLEAVFEDADVLVLPTTDCPAPTRAEAGNTDDEYRAPIVRRLTRICGPVNVCGLAALALPCGMSEDGLPIGMQLVGRSESLLLGLGRLYQSLTEWHQQRPSSSVGR